MGFFSGRHFPRDIILWAVRWYCRYGLSYRDLEDVVYNERLAQHGIAASTGTVGDSYDNALAENVNGSYKNELLHTRRWDDVVEVEFARLKWVSWWNETRLHQSLGYRTPVEVETEFWKQNPP